MIGVCNPNVSNVPSERVVIIWFDFSFLQRLNNIIDADNAVT